MPNRNTIRTRAEVRLDVAAWARVYGLDPADRVAITEDMQTWAYNLLSQAAEQSGVLEGPSSEWARS